MRHHACKGHHFRHVLRSLRNWDCTAQPKWVEERQGRTDIFHKHLKEMFADPLHKKIPERIWQRWSFEVLQSLSTIDGQRVREAAYAPRKRTSCADDHLVIEMPSETSKDTWETLAKSFQFRLLNHWTEEQDMLVTMVKIKNDRLYSKVCQHLVGQTTQIRYSSQYHHNPDRHVKTTPQRTHFCDVKHARIWYTDWVDDDRSQSDHNIQNKITLYLELRIRDEIKLT